MADIMKALVYEAPKQMTVREVPVPSLQTDEVLIKIAYSGICGSELSGYLGKNALRQPPLIMGHEFSGTIAGIGSQAQHAYPQLAVGAAVTANPLLSCGDCSYCQSNRQQLCPYRKLLSASLPGSNAEYLAVRADAVLPLPEGISLMAGALTEPTACAVHAVKLVQPSDNETALVIGAGPIGLLTIQVLINQGLNTVFCSDLNSHRLEMAASLGAEPVQLDNFDDKVDIAIDAVGIEATRRSCIEAVHAGGRIIWEGLHVQNSNIPFNELIRREIASFGSFGYTHQDFHEALAGLAQGRFALSDTMTRAELLENGTRCFEELIQGSPTAKIWLTPQVL